MPTPFMDEWGLVRSDAEDTEESYFVSMTDIMVGLLFIFILMLMAFALMLKDAQQETRVLTADIESVVRQSAEEIQRIQDVDALRSSMLTDIAERLRRRGVQVVVRPESGVIQLPDEILFPSGQSTLTPQGIQAIGHLAEALDAVLPCYADGSGDVQDSARCQVEVPDEIRLDAVFVEGHTDSDGSDAYNWQLSAARAINTFMALEEQGARSLRLRNTQGQFLFSVAGYGENRPVTAELTEADKHQNRRIDLRFVMQVSHADALERVRSMLVEAID